MNRWLPSHPRIFLLVLSVLFSAAIGAIAAEPGHLLIYKGQGGFGTEIHKVRKLERIEGFFVAHLFSGKTERFDAFRVGLTLDLATLQPANFKQLEDIQSAKAAEAKAEAAIKQYPDLKTHVAPHLAQLRTEIARAERGEKKIDGKWLTAEEAAALYAREQSTVTRGTLQLTDGTTYRDVDVVSITPEELRIMHSDGAAKIPMRLVPDDFKRKHLPAPGTSAPARAK